MLSDVDIYRAAHLMMHEYGNNAEREAARCADRMLGRGDREELLNWFRIGRTIAVMRPGTDRSTKLNARWAGTRIWALA
jgi:hypothetical protein